MISLTPVLAGSTRTTPAVTQAWAPPLPDAGAHTPAVALLSIAVAFPHKLPDPGLSGNGIAWSRLGKSDSGTITVWLYAASLANAAPGAVEISFGAVAPHGVSWALDLAHGAQLPGSPQSRWDSEYAAFAAAAPLLPGLGLQTLSVAPGGPHLLTGHAPASPSVMGAAIAAAGVTVPLVRAPVLSAASHDAGRCQDLAQPPQARLGGIDIRQARNGPSSPDDYSAADSGRPSPPPSGTADFVQLLDGGEIAQPLTGTGPLHALASAPAPASPPSTGAPQIPPGRQSPAAWLATSPYSLGMPPPVGLSDADTGVHLDGGNPGGAPPGSDFIYLSDTDFTTRPFGVLPAGFDVCTLNDQGSPGPLDNDSASAVDGGEITELGHDLNGAFVEASALHVYAVSDFLTALDTSTFAGSALFAPVLPQTRAPGLMAPSSWVTPPFAPPPATTDSGQAFILDADFVIAQDGKGAPPLITPANSADSIACFDAAGKGTTQNQLATSSADTGHGAESYGDSWPPNDHWPLLLGDGLVPA